MTPPEPRLSPLVGPWGDEDCTTMMFPVCNEYGAQVHSELDALTEYCRAVDDWSDYALSVEGPLMYHAIPGDYDERIEPCECFDDHPGQVEVWRVVSQAQEPTARARERNRIVKFLRGHLGTWEPECSGCDSFEAFEDRINDIENRAHHA